MSRATRAAYGQTLNELYAQGIPVVAVDADLSGSTTTAKFGAQHPERLFNAGIAEANMTDVAAGLALAGHVAFTGSFAVFGTGRAYDQIRNTVCYNRLNVKLAPTHAGVTVGPDGGSHQMLEDIALMRVLPHMRVLVPADFATARAAIRHAAVTPGPFYIRLGRAGVPDLYGPDGVTGIDPDSDRFDVCAARVLRTGSDVSLFACGVMVSAAIEAAALLADAGVDAEVVDVMSIKPLDVDTLVASARKTGRVVTCEEHNVLGGMGSAVSEVLSELCPVPTRRVGVADCFGTSGKPDELLAHFGLDKHAIAQAARSF
ncbi:MAG: transketolase family protein [Actinomycetes bacterium]|jgi:transketolase|nr:transketolase family protein [Actinomycetes bacterium]